MSDQTLQHIQSLQFSDRPAANEQLKVFFNGFLPFAVTSVAVRPLAVSLNSINGVLTTAEGKRLFFKTHIEPQSIINEYYNAGILAESGYPVIQPIYSSTEWGKQLLIYEYFDAPSLFNVIWEIETGQRQDAASIVAIQQQADDLLWKIYRETLAPVDADEHAQAPVHQLFYHRLTGGRFDQFYRGAEIVLPGQHIRFEDLATMQWVINGVEFEDTLDELVQQAIEVLQPACRTLAVIGHGDAHNGNVFIDETQGRLIYFDPAFAGRHSPFLDLAKPLFHNVFAIWMYFPLEVATTLSITLDMRANTLVVDHDFVPTDVRIALLRSKLQRVLKPLLQELHTRGGSVSNWQQYLKLALFCCPFLTMNLSDTQRFPPEITLLGLALAIEMGSRSQRATKGLLDTELGMLAAEI